MLAAESKHFSRKESKSENLWQYQAFTNQVEVFGLTEYQQKDLESQMGELAAKSFVFNHVRDMDLRFDCVLLFLMAHELGHHALGTSGQSTPQAERDADAFAVTLLAPYFASLALVQESRVTVGANKTPNSTVYLDRNLFGRYLGYATFFGPRLAHQNRTGLDEDDDDLIVTTYHDKPKDRIRFLEDRVRQILPVLSKRIAPKVGVLRLVNGSGLTYDLEKMISQGNYLWSN
jgi:hypothetical protein